MSKILITSGCSFSECHSPRKAIATWPRHLEDSLKQHDFKEFMHGGLGSQGNGLISRKVIYYVTEALKNYKPNEILVGVMWSGPDRADYRCFSPDLLQFKKQNIYNGWHENPTGFVKGAPQNWVIMNHHWGFLEPRNPECIAYYENFYDKVGSIIYSIEHMLRVQWFLKQHGIKYFFTIFHDFVLNEKIDNIEIKYLYDLLNKANFLPVSSQAEWLHKRCNMHLGAHPTTEEHKIFTDEIILPFLKQKNIIN